MAVELCRPEISKDIYIIFPSKPMTDKADSGRKGRVKGRVFELKVRKDLERQGWIVAKWTNNVEFNGESGNLIPAKRKYNPFTKFASFGNGFPDFVAYKLQSEAGNCYEVVGIEVKSRGYLDKDERLKCQWLLKNRTFGKIVVAKRGKKRGEILYEEVNSS